MNEGEVIDILADELILLWRRMREPGMPIIQWDATAWIARIEDALRRAGQPLCTCQALRRPAGHESDCPSSAR